MSREKPPLRAGSQSASQSALQALYRMMEEEIVKLTEQVAQQAKRRWGARQLMTHPGVGPVTALATDVFLGDPQRFADGKALASYVGMIPREYSSGERLRRMDHFGECVRINLCCLRSTITMSNSFRKSIPSMPSTFSPMLFESSFVSMARIR
jgi:transposase